MFTYTHLQVSSEQQTKRRHICFVLLAQNTSRERGREREWERASTPRQVCSEIKMKNQNKIKKNIFTHVESLPKCLLMIIKYEVKVYSR